MIIVIWKDRNLHAHCSRMSLDTSKEGIGRAVVKGCKLGEIPKKGLIASMLVKKVEKLSL